MELNLSAEDAAFRDEVRSFITGAYPRNARRQPETDLTKEQSLLWHRILHKKGLDRAALAEGVWRTRLVSHPALHLGPGDLACGDASSARLQRDHSRPGHLHVREGGAEGEVPATHIVGRGLVVPRLLGAGFGVGSSLGQDQGGS